MGRYGLKILMCLLLTGGTAWACFWDSDTIESELKGVPDREVLVSNRWHRHGFSYYQERIDRLASKSEKSPEEFDDLAIAFERRQDFDKALAILDEKLQYLENHPDEEHLYRFHANYGTVLAHAGRYEEALEQLEKALELNPDAHFGREEFQVHLIRYALAAKKDPTLWESQNFLAYAKHPASFDHLYRILAPSYKATWDGVTQAEEEDLEKAFQGVAGMLRFGGREGPELYRVLGDLSVAQGHLNVAWYCYQMAVLKEHPAGERITQTIKSIEEHWETSDPRRLPNEDHFELVYETSQEWLRAFQQAEGRALSEGRKPSDPKVLEALLAEADAAVPPIELAVYKSKPVALLDTLDPGHKVGYKTDQLVPILYLCGGAFVLISILVVAYFRRRPRRVDRVN